MLTIWCKQLLKGSHLGLLALQLKGQGGQGDIAHIAMKDVSQVQQLSPLLGIALQLDEH